MSDFVLQYNGKPVDVKITFEKRFKLISTGLTFAEGLITENSSVENFCKVWSFLLNEPFNGDTEAFLKGFNSLEAVNPYYISILYRDGVIADSEKEADKEAEAKKKAS